ncbi:MAG: hypothetical protein CL731_06660 [Chloroflexi bacterium]|nr:hypothetical protein [Chloroflexota bacterium]MBO04677.1 hypothetical protein [Chloroflexota bacterium]|tara:strand:+ start:1592 stop:1867 length:276 start_codon:yes stop_codon:yes gene_type:complete
MALKQRLLYLSSQSTDPRSPAISQALHEPVKGTIVEIDPTKTGIDYDSVYDAICDGWRVVHFPDQRGSIEYSEIEVYGYQFVLEKMEEFND